MSTAPTCNTRHPVPRVPDLGGTGYTVFADPYAKHLPQRIDTFLAHGAPGVQP